MNYGTDYIDFSILSATEIIRIISKRIREYRLRQGLTQQELAEKTGLGKLTISKIERGISSDMSLKTFLLILKVLGDIRAFETIIPELPESPYGRPYSKPEKKRIRH